MAMSGASQASGRIRLTVPGPDLFVLGDLRHGGRPAFHRAPRISHKRDQFRIAVRRSGLCKENDGPVATLAPEGHRKADGRRQDHLIGVALEQRREVEGICKCPSPNSTLWASTSINVS